MEMLRDLTRDWTVRFILAIIAALFALIPLTIRAMHQEAKEWAAFAEAHDCKVVGKISGSTGTGLGVGVMPNGQIGTVMTTTTIPGKTGYACNDGVTYWR
jgi:hypothetical protein